MSQELLTLSVKLDESRLQSYLKASFTSVSEQLNKDVSALQRMMGTVREAQTAMASEMDVLKETVSSLSAKVDYNASMGSRAGSRRSLWDRKSSRAAGSLPSEEDELAASGAASVPGGRGGRIVGEGSQRTRVVLRRGGKGGSVLERVPVGSPPRTPGVARDAQTRAGGASPSRSGSAKPQQNSRPGSALSRSGDSPRSGGGGGGGGGVGSDSGDVPMEEVVEKYVDDKGVERERIVQVPIYDGDDGYEFDFEAEDEALSNALVSLQEQLQHFVMQQEETDRRFTQNHVQIAARIEHSHVILQRLMKFLGVESHAEHGMIPDNMLDSPYISDVRSLITDAEKRMTKIEGVIKGKVDRRDVEQLGYDVQDMRGFCTAAVNRQDEKIKVLAGLKTDKAKEAEDTRMKDKMSDMEDWRGTVSHILQQTVTGGKTQELSLKQLEHDFYNFRTMVLELQAQQQQGRRRTGSRIVAAQQSAQSDVNLSAPRPQPDPSPPLSANRSANDSSVAIDVSAVSANASVFPSVSAGEMSPSPQEASARRLEPTGDGGAVEPLVPTDATGASLSRITPHLGAAADARTSAYPSTSPHQSAHAQSDPAAGRAPPAGPAGALSRSADAVLSQHHTSSLSNIQQTTSMGSASFTAPMRGGPPGSGTMQSRHQSLAEQARQQQHERASQRFTAYVLTDTPQMAPEASRSIKVPRPKSSAGPKGREKGVKSGP